MMKYYLPRATWTDAGVAGPIHLTFDHFDLQIIQAVPQVKTPLPGNPGQFCKFFRFQTIGVRLACWFRDVSIGRRVACGLRHHQNKLGFRLAWI